MFFTAEEADSQLPGSGAGSGSFVEKRKLMAADAF